MPALLLDTCALIFLAADESSSAEVQVALEEASASGDPIFVSPISAWEIGLLVAKGRLNISMSPQRWFELFLERSGAELADMSIDILIASSFLPNSPLRDPADRILAATARERGLTLVTRDRNLLSYADTGHLRAMPC